MARPVFVSYSQTDRECAFELVARVEAEGIACWIAPRDVAPSAEWAAEIIDAISAAKLMVLVFSVSSNDSPQVRREVERAVHKQLPVISFRIDDVLPAKSLEYFLSSRHWLDAFPTPREQYYDKLCQHLKHALGTDGIDRNGAGRDTVGRDALGSDTLDRDGVVRDALGSGSFGRGAASLAPTQPGAANPAAVFSPADLEQVELQLARYLGPIAKILVKRAAARASSIADLKRRLAGELESETERRQFIAGAGTQTSVTATR